MNKFNIEIIYTSPCHNMHATWSTYTMSTKMSLGPLGNPSYVCIGGSLEARPIICVLTRGVTSITLVVDAFISVGGVTYISPIAGLSRWWVIVFSPTFCLSSSAGAWTSSTNVAPGSSSVSQVHSWALDPLHRIV